MKPWIVHFISDRGPGHWYRFHISGENLNYSEAHPNRWFCWNVPDLDCDQYDLGRAETVPMDSPKHWGKVGNAHRSESLRVTGDVQDAADNTGDF